MLGKQRSFDLLMSLNFKSMQNTNKFANLIQHPGGHAREWREEGHGTGMKNADWVAQDEGELPWASPARTPQTPLTN